MSKAENKLNNMSKSDWLEANNQTKRHREVNGIIYNDIPSSRIPYIAEALKEVELIESGKLKAKSAREFLEELRDENPESN